VKRLNDLEQSSDVPNKQENYSKFTGLSYMTNICYLEQLSQR